MSDTSPTPLENRLSSRLSRSFAPGNRLMERVARHAGAHTPVQRANERVLGSISRMESFGSGVLGAIISRLSTRGAFRAAMPAYGSWGGGEFVTQAPPWMAAPVEPEAPVGPAPSPWYSPMRGINPTVRGVPSTASIARSAARPPGFSGARRSAMAAPELPTAGLPAALLPSSAPVSTATTASGSWSRPLSTAAVARSASSRPVSALARAAVAGMTNDLAPARVARSSRGVAPAAARVLSRAAGTELGAARRAVSRSVESELPVSSAGRALARSADARPSGRGFAVARSSFGLTAGAPSLDLARAPISRSAEVEATEAAPAPDLASAWNTPLRETVGARVVRSAAPQRETVGARVARSIARSAATERASTRPLARATAASATAPEAPRGFSPLTSPARRSVARQASPFVGAAVASPVYGSGAPARRAASSNAS